MQSMIARNDSDGHLERSERSQSNEILRLPTHSRKTDTLTLSSSARTPRNDIKPNPSQPSLRKGRRIGFTLAEVLITLGIIGVVAALTIPQVIQNYKKFVTVSRLKQTYTLLKSAEQSAINDFGDVQDWDFSSNGISYGETFAKKYYAPYLKTTNCKYLAKYGETGEKITTSTGALALYTFWQDNAFCLPNGAMIFASNIGSNGRVSGKIIYVDINGTSKPNVFGRDIFSFMVGNTKMKQIDGYYYMDCPARLSTCSPQGFIIYTHKAWDADHDELINACKSKGGNSGMNACAYLIESAGWDIPKDYPVKL